MLGLTGALSTSSEKEQNYALSFDGVNDYVNLGPSNGIITASQDPVSFSCWVKTTTTSTGYIFSCQKGIGSSAFSVNIQTNGTARGVVWKGDGAHSFPVSTTAVNDGNWHHVAVVAKNNSQKVYVDGSLEAEQTHTMDLPTSTDHCSIGAHGAGTNNFYNGSLTGLAVYTVELDANAIASIYNAGRHHNLNTPIGNYSSTPSHYYALGHGLFDDKASGVVHDQANPGFGSELLLNNSFDELSDELITNGDFSTSGDVTTSSFSLGWKIDNSANLGVSIVNNQLLLSRPVGENTDYGRVYATNGLNSINVKPSDHSGNVFKLEFEIVAKTGTPTLKWYNNGYITFFDTTLGKKTIYFTSATNRLVVFKQDHEGSSITLDNISLKEVDPNGRWTLDADWSIEDGELKASTPGGTVATAQTVDGFTAGKTYKLRFDVPTVTQGFFRAYAYVGSSGTFTKILQSTDGETGRYETIFEFGGSNKTFRFYGSPAGGDLTIGSINNASLKQINDAAGIVAGATFVADN